MAKKKNRDLVEEQGVGYIKVQVMVVKKRGGIIDRHTTKFGFAAIYTLSDLKKAARELKDIAVDSARRANPDAEKITANVKIFHTECEYILPPGKASEE